MLLVYLMIYYGKPEKKFLSGQAIKALPPPPLKLYGHLNFFFTLKIT